MKKMLALYTNKGQKKKNITGTFLLHFFFSFIFCQYCQFSAFILKIDPGAKNPFDSKLPSFQLYFEYCVQVLLKISNLS